MERLRNIYCNKQNLLHCYTVTLALLSITIFLMPFVNSIKKETEFPMYIVGASFWIALILTLIISSRINNLRRNSTAFNNEYNSLRKLALIHFFQNKPAIIMDAIMFASLIAFVIARLVTDNLIIQFLFVSMFAFSFGMHCMLNGINYIYIKYKSTVRRD